MKKSGFTAMALGCLLACLMAIPVRAQSTGSIEGTVTDPSGAVVANANLKATNAETGIVFETTSNQAGLYRFPFLPVGTYDLTAQAAGFGTQTRKGVGVTVGAKISLDLPMTVATQQANVEVTAEVPVVETTRSSVAATVDDRSVANLPTNGRNFMDFVQLTPGVTRDVRTGDISFAGQRGTLNSLQIDGADNNNTFFGQTTGRTGSGRAPYQFSEDAVQEFQVNSNAYSAELGHAGGAVINVVTKSGTNEFHGAAFEFFRDRGLNANDPINISRRLPRSPYHFNQFGGNVGGPIIKDKLFFFFDYDGQRNTLPNTVFLGVAPPASPTANEQTALAYLQARDSSWIRTQNQNVYLGKVDWKASASQLVGIRYNAQRFVGAGFEN